MNKPGHVGSERRLPCPPGTGWDPDIRHNAGPSVDDAFYIGIVAVVWRRGDKTTGNVCRTSTSTSRLSIVHLRLLGSSGTQ